MLPSSVRMHSSAWKYLDAKMTGIYILTPQHTQINILLVLISLKVNMHIKTK